MVIFLLVESALENQEPPLGIIIKKSVMEKSKLTEKEDFLLLKSQKIYTS